MHPSDADASLSSPLRDLRAGGGGSASETAPRLVAATASPKLSFARGTPDR